MRSEEMQQCLSLADEVLQKYPNAQDHLIALLQELQDVYGYLSTDVLLHVSKVTGIAPAKLSGVVTFYAQFRTAPPGIYQVLVCMGTACHVNGGATVAEAVEAALGVKEGQTTEDGLFSWEKAACLGCCSLSPVMMVNGRAYGKLTVDGIEDIFSTIRASHTGGDTSCAF